MYHRWTPTEEQYLVDHQDDSNEGIATALKLKTDAVKRKRYSPQMRLLQSPKRTTANRRAATARRRDIWEAYAAQLAILHADASALIAEFGPAEAHKRLKPRIDIAGPERSLNAIQLMCSKLGLLEPDERRDRRLASIRPAAAEARRLMRQIPHSLSWDHLAFIEQVIILFSVLGDGSVTKPKAGNHHQYKETKKLDHKPYLQWKRSMLRAEFAGSFKEDDPSDRDPKCVWETGVSQIFTLLRDNFYPDGRAGTKSIIREWVVYQTDSFGDLALLGLLIWLLDDGRNNSPRGYPNLEICIERWEFNLPDVERVCDFFKRKFGLHLYVRVGSNNTSHTLVIPAEDRNRLVPIWRRYARGFGLPPCMDYKYPNFRLPLNGPSRRLLWEQKHFERRRELAQITYQMRQDGKTFVDIGRFLSDQGHPLKTTARYLPGVWKRLGYNPYFRVRRTGNARQDAVGGKAERIPPRS